MTKAEIVNAIATSTGIEKQTVASALESIMETIKGSLIQGEPVYLRGFGTFGIKHRAAKPADIPYFKPAKEFKENVNK